jgi:hypothetical protein
MECLSVLLGRQRWYWRKSIAFVAANIRVESKTAMRSIVEIYRGACGEVKRVRRVGRMVGMTYAGTIREGATTNQPT